MLFIQTKEAKLVEFVPNIIQLRLLKHIAKRIAEHVPVRLTIPKARQHGITTLLTAIAYCMTAFRHDRFALTSADQKDKATAIFDKAKLMHEKMDPLIRTETQRSNAKELIFSETRSVFRIGTAGNEELGRSQTYQFFHGSEVAYYQNAKEVMKGVMQCVPDYWDTIVALESTGNGAGGLFHEICDKADKGENDWDLFFIPWFENPEYTRPIPSNYKLIPQSEGRWGDEVFYQTTYKLTDEQLYWRRNKIDNACNGNLLTFMQEYPANLKECFQASGFPVWDQLILDEIDRTMVRHPDKEAIIIKKNNKNQVKFAPGGWMKMWTMPNREWNDRYVAFADTGGFYDGADYYSVHVYDRVEKEVSAVIHGHFKPYIFAWYLLVLSYFYDKALVVIEINQWASEVENNGMTVLDNVLNNYQYPNLYIRQVYDENTRQFENKYGFHTNKETKQMLIDRGHKYIDEESKLIKINDKETVKEMMTYIINTESNDTVYTAVEGGHDDRVISFLGALLISDSMQEPTKKPIKTKKTKPKSGDPIVAIGG